MSKQTLAEPVILCDIDGVLANFVQAMIDTHGWSIGHDEYLGWDFHRDLGMTDDEFWKPTHDGVWWTKVAPYSYATEFVAALREIGSVVFCTSPSLDETCASQKVKWLRDHGLMDRQRNDFDIGPYKYLKAKSDAILIDDSETNINQYRAAGGRAILFPQPWNEKRELSLVNTEIALGNLLEMLA